MAKTVGMGAVSPDTKENREIAELKREVDALKKENAKLKKQLKKESAPEDGQDGQ